MARIPEDKKNELKNTTTTGGIVAENVISLDVFKDIDEEVQYAIANHQSYLNPRSKEAVILYLILIVSFLNATSSGFDGSLMGSINAQDQYKSFFHLKETGSSTGLVFILYNAASMIGCAFGGPVMDYFGRRRGMQSGCLFTLGGAVLASAAQTLDQFKASRFLLGFGIILQTLAAPVYVTEITPPQWRGRLGGYYNTFYFVGYDLLFLVSNCSSIFGREALTESQINYSNRSRLCNLTISKHVSLATSSRTPSHPSFPGLRRMLLHPRVPSMAS